MKKLQVFRKIPGLVDVIGLLISCYSFSFAYMTTAASFYFKAGEEAPLISGLLLIVGGLGACYFLLLIARTEIVEKEEATIAPFIFSGIPMIFLITTIGGAAAMFSSFSGRATAELLTTLLQWVFFIFAVPLLLYLPLYHSFSEKYQEFSNWQREYRAAKVEDATNGFRAMSFKGLLRLQASKDYFSLSDVEKEAIRIVTREHLNKEQTRLKTRERTTETTG